MTRPLGKRAVRDREARWLVAFPPPWNYYAVSPDILQLVKSVELPQLLELCRERMRLGVCDEVEVDPPRCRYNECRKIPIAFGPGFRVWTD